MNKEWNKILSRLEETQISSQNMIFLLLPSLYLIYIFFYTIIIGCNSFDPPNIKKRHAQFLNALERKKTHWTHEHIFKSQQEPPGPRGRRRSMKSKGDAHASRKAPSHEFRHLSPALVSMPCRALLLLAPYRMHLHAQAAVVCTSALVDAHRPCQQPDRLCLRPRQ